MLKMKKDSGDKCRLEVQTKEANTLQNTLKEYMSRMCQKNVISQTQTFRVEKVSSHPLYWPNYFLTLSSHFFGGTTSLMYMAPERATYLNSLTLYPGRRVGHQGKL